MEQENSSEQVAKNNRQVATDDSTNNESTTTDTLDGERPEMPADMENMGTMSGPMGGGFPGEMTTTTVANTTNEWLVPLTCTGIMSGVVIIATAVICFMIYKFGKKN